MLYNRLFYHKLTSLKGGHDFGPGHYFQHYRLQDLDLLGTNFRGINDLRGGDHLGAET